MPQFITPTQAEKDEWSRMAQAAYRANRNDLGHLFSAAASIAQNDRVRLDSFDLLQTIYRQWLVFGRWPCTRGQARDN